MEQHGGDATSQQKQTTPKLQAITQLLRKKSSLAKSRVEFYSKPPWWIQAASKETSTLAGRASFLAGFSYYEFSRQSEENVERVPYYTTFLIGAFTVSIVVVVRDAILQRMFRQVNRGDLLALTKVLRTGKQGYVHTTYRLFQFAFHLYILALAHMADVYNPDMKTNEAHLYHATRYLPYATVLLALWVSRTFNTHINDAYEHKGTWPLLDVEYSWDKKV